MAKDARFAHEFKPNIAMKKAAFYTWLFDQQHGI
jgi:hypothetical protein